MEEIMEDFKSSVKPVIEANLYDVIISKEGQHISLRLPRYDLEAIGLYNLLHAGCIISIEMSNGKV